MKRLNSASERTFISKDSESLLQRPRSYRGGINANRNHEEIIKIAKAEKERK